MKNGFKVQSSKIPFYSAFFIYIILMMYGTTMFMEIVPVTSMMYTIARTFLIFSTVYLCWVKKRLFSKVQFRYIVIIGIILLVVVISTRYTTILDSFLLCLLATSLDIREICKHYLKISVPFLLITVGASLTGVIQNYTVYVDNRIRLSYGFIYPTDFAAHIFYVWLAYWGSAKNDFKYRNMILPIFMAFFLYDKSYAKLDSILFIAGAVFLLFVSFCEKKEKTEWLYKLGMMSFPACMILSVLASYLYRKSSFLQWLDVLLTHRISSGDDAFSKYGFSLFGHYIRQQGFGWTPNGFDNSFGYFFIDNGYHTIILCYGILFTIIVLASYLYSIRFHYNAGNFRIVAILILISISNLVDCRFLNPGYSPFFVLFFCPWIMNVRSNNIKINNLIISK